MTVMSFSPFKRWTVDSTSRRPMKGWDVPLDALRVEDCAAAVAGALKKG